MLGMRSTFKNFVSRMPRNKILQVVQPLIEASTVYNSSQQNIYEAQAEAIRLVEDIIRESSAKQAFEMIQPLIEGLSKSVGLSADAIGKQHKIEVLIEKVVLKISKDNNQKAATIIMEALRDLKGFETNSTFLTRRVLADILVWPFLRRNNLIEGVTEGSPLYEMFAPFESALGGLFSVSSVEIDSEENVISLFPSYGSAEKVDSILRDLYQGLEMTNDVLEKEERIGAAVTKLDEYEKLIRAQYAKGKGLELRAEGEEPEDEIFKAEAKSLGEEERIDYAAVYAEMSVDQLFDLLEAGQKAGDPPGARRLMGQQLAYLFLESSGFALEEVRVAQMFWLTNALSEFFRIAPQNLPSKEALTFFRSHASLDKVMQILTNFYEKFQLTAGKDKQWEVIESAVNQIEEYGTFLIAEHKRQRAALGAKRRAEEEASSDEIFKAEAKSLGDLDELRAKSVEELMEMYSSRSVSVDEDADDFLEEGANIMAALTMKLISGTEEQMAKFYSLAVDFFIKEHLDSYAVISPLRAITMRIPIDYLASAREQIAEAIGRFSMVEEVERENSAPLLAGIMAQAMIREQGLSINSPIIGKVKETIAINNGDFYLYPQYQKAIDQGTLQILENLSQEMKIAKNDSEKASATEKADKKLEELREYVMAMDARKRQPVKARRQPEERAPPEDEIFTVEAKSLGATQQKLDELEERVIQKIGQLNAQKAFQDLMSLQANPLRPDLEKFIYETLETIKAPIEDEKEARDFEIELRILLGFKIASKEFVEQYEDKNQVYLKPVVNRSAVGRILQAIDPEYIEDDDIRLFVKKTQALLSIKNFFDNHFNFDSFIEFIVNMVLRENPEISHFLTQLNPEQSLVDLFESWAYQVSQDYGERDGIMVLLDLAKLYRLQFSDLKPGGEDISEHTISNFLQGDLEAISENDYTRALVEEDINVVRSILTVALMEGRKGEDDKTTMGYYFQKFIPKGIPKIREKLPDATDIEIWEGLAEISKTARERLQPMLKKLLGLKGESDKYANIIKGRVERFKQLGVILGQVGETAFDEIPFEKLRERYNIEEGSSEEDRLLKIIADISRTGKEGTAGLVAEIFDLYQEEAGTTLDDFNKLLRTFSYFVKVVNFHYDFERLVLGDPQTGVGPQIGTINNETYFVSLRDLKKTLKIIKQNFDQGVEIRDAVIKAVKRRYYHRLGSDKDRARIRALMATHRIIRPEDQLDFIYEIEGYEPGAEEIKISEKRRPKTIQKLEKDDKKSSARRKR